MTPLHTNRLVLRPFGMPDARPLTQLIADPCVHKWITRAPRPFRVSDAQDFICKHMKSGQMVYALTLDGTLIGCCSVSDDELGYWVGQPYWGNGFATEAASAVVNAYFSEKETPLISGHLEGNTGSHNVLIKLGFKDNGVRHRRSEFYDREVVIQNMELSKQDWQARP